MSIAAFVPETFDREGDSVTDALRRAGLHRIVVDAAVRLRTSDGFSHARSLAFLTALIAVQGLVAITGLASALGRSRVGAAARGVVEGTAPGAVGTALAAAIDQAHRTGDTGRFIGLSLGVLGSIVTGTSAGGQLQRSLNRIYGIRDDRPTVQKYARALALTATAGVLITAAFVAIAFGRFIGDAIADNVFTPVWGALRLPIALALGVTAVMVLYRSCPTRHQPDWRWLAPGAVVAMTLWATFTFVLGSALAASPSFGDAYGPMAGLVALLLWSFLSSVALLYGAAVAAEIESVRATSERRSSIHRVRVTA